MVSLPVYSVIKYVKKYNFRKLNNVDNLLISKNSGWRDTEMDLTIANRYTDTIFEEKAIITVIM